MIFDINSNQIFLELILKEMFGAFLKS
jgi:hypothetical protein